MQHTGFINWATRSFPPPGEAVTLTRQRVFILPTGYGVLLAFLLLLMLLAALNYDNNLAFLLTFLLAGMALNTLYFSYRNLAGITLTALPQSEAFAGETVCYRVGVENPTALDRYGLSLTIGGQASVGVDAPAGKPTVLESTVSTMHRGLLQPGRFAVGSRAPLGLFRTWTWQQLDSPVWVYPSPLATSEPPLHAAGKFHQMANASVSGDEFDRLRPYRPGDPVRHIAWKKQARNNELVVKQFQQSMASEQIFSWYALPGGEVETRLSQLCYWILNADHGGRRYGLILPDRKIPSGRGEAHRRRCLRALAEF